MAYLQNLLWLCSKIPKLGSCLTWKNYHKIQLLHSVTFKIMCENDKEAVSLNQLIALGRFRQISHGQSRIFRSWEFFRMSDLHRHPKGQTDLPMSEWPHHLWGVLSTASRESLPLWKMCLSFSSLEESVIKLQLTNWLLFQYDVIF